MLVVHASHDLCALLSILSSEPWQDAEPSLSNLQRENLLGLLIKGQFGDVVQTFHRFGIGLQCLYVRWSQHASKFQERLLKCSDTNTLGISTLHTRRTSNQLSNIDHVPMCSHDMRQYCFVPAKLLHLTLLASKPGEQWRQTRE